MICICLVSQQRAQDTGLMLKPLESGLFPQGLLNFGMAYKEDIAALPIYIVPVTNSSAQITTFGGVTERHVSTVQ